MRQVFLMSHPGPTWRIRGGENFRSEERRPVSPRRALAEWLALADAIERAGGRVLVLPAPAADPPLTGLIYTANVGDLFHREGGLLFLVSRMAAPHRRAESEVVRAFVRELGLATLEAQAAWEGQAEVQRVAGRWIATFGVRSDRASVAEVRALAAGAPLLELEIRAPFFHGDTCLNALPGREGEILLAHEEALVGADRAALERFLGGAAEVVPVDRADALGYACNALAVGRTLLAPAGLSAGLLAGLESRGLAIVELALDELFGKGGGGPRCLVNELRGYDPPPGGADYAAWRDELYEGLERWPEPA